MWTETIDGKTVYRERMTDPITGKVKNFSARAKKETPQGRKEAMTRLYEKVNAWKGDGPEELTLSGLIDKYNADLSKTVRPSTAYRYKTAFNRILRTVGDVNIQKVTAGYIRQRLIDLKPTTANEYIKRLTTMFRWAYRNGYIDSTAAVDRLTRFKEPPHREKIKDKFLEADEVFRVIEALPIQHALTASFMCLSGLRFGEVAGLDGKDVKRDRIEVRQAYDIIFHEIHEPKTQTSLREVPVNDELRAIIKKIREYTTMIREMTRTKCPAFILTPEGGRLQIAAFNKALKAATLKVVGRPLTSHALRHTFASLLMEHGVALDTIMRVLGHQSSSITKRIYLHVTEELKRKDAEALNSVSFFEKNGRKMGEL